MFTSSVKDTRRFGQYYFHILHDTLLHMYLTPCFYGREMKRSAMFSASKFKQPVSCLQNLHCRPTRTEHDISVWSFGLIVPLWHTTTNSRQLIVRENNCKAILPTCIFVKFVAHVPQDMPTLRHRNEYIKIKDTKK